MKQLTILLVGVLLIGCNSKAQQKEEKVFPLTKTEAEWKSQLTENQFMYCEEAGTERPFTSPLNKNYDKGTYVCAACNTPLFNSGNKFDSGTGWPSFDKEIEGNVGFSVDYKTGYARTEEHCATCGGHLGHVFNDGPSQTQEKDIALMGSPLNLFQMIANKYPVQKQKLSG